MTDQTPIFDPKNNWDNIQRWIERDDAKRTQLMRFAVREELKPVVPIMKRVGRLEMCMVVLVAFDIGTLLYLIVQS